MYITSIDIGSKNIKAIVLEVKRNNSVLILRTINMPSEGVRKGEIIHPEETVKPLFSILKEIKRIDKKSLKNLLFSISSSKSSFLISKSVISISRSDQKISDEDIDRSVNEAIKASKATGWKIIHSDPQEFVIDGMPVDSKSVYGLSGRRIESNVVVISVFGSVYNNLMKLIHLVLGRNSFGGGLFFTPFSSERAVLSVRQRDLGVLMIDIGAGTTGVVLYQERKIIYTKIFPFGSDNITNDIVAGLKCSFDIADKIKEKFGVAISKEVSLKDKINLSQFDSADSRVISNKYISEIIEARVREIFRVIKDDIKPFYTDNNLPAGVVLTGGGSKMIGMTDVVRDELKLPVQIGVPNIKIFNMTDNKLLELIEDPEMSTSVGMLLNELDILNDSGKIKIEHGGGIDTGGSKIIKHIKFLFKILFKIE